MVVYSFFVTWWPHNFNFEIQGYSRTFKDIFQLFQGQPAPKFKDIQGKANDFFMFSRGRDGKFKDTSPNPVPIDSIDNVR